MSKDEDQKLAAIMARRITSDRDLADAKAAKEAAQQKDEEKKQAARLKWNETVNDIRAVVKKLNTDLKPSGISLEFALGGSEGQTLLGQVLVHLDKNNRLAINADPSGLTKPKMVIKNHSQDAPEFNILDVEPSHYRTLIIEFLDRAV